MDEKETIAKCLKSFPDFIKYIFPSSFKHFIPAEHLFTWGERIQNNKRTATLSARKHLKSTLIYAYLMWRILRMKDSEDWLYMSYTEPLSRYHTTNIKRLVQRNPFFTGIKDLTQAESHLKYSWNGTDVFSVQPASIMRFNRGWHGYGVIADDILADPTSELNFTIINTINNTFFEEVLSLPIEGGELHLVGTAQHQEDLFFKIREKASSFNWGMYPAILNETERKTLWEEMFSFERLIEIRDTEIGEKAFKKEYLCSPVWTEESYFKPEEINPLIDKDLRNVIGNDSEAFAGLDIGKVRHPSHLTVFSYSRGLIMQIYMLFMDGWDYTKQVELINSLIPKLNIKKIYYDDTRGELESFAEQGIIRRGIWVPVKFTQYEKTRLAANFQKTVMQGNLRLQASERQRRSILSVNNNLDAIETPDGHGDAFWSIALALSHRQSRPIPVVGSGRYK